VGGAGLRDRDCLVRDLRSGGRVRLQLRQSSENMRIMTYNTDWLELQEDNACRSFRRRAA
jgi:hypothetical protein